MSLALYIVIKLVLAEGIIMMGVREERFRLDMAAEFGWTIGVTPFAPGGVTAAAPPSFGRSKIQFNRY